MSKKTEMAVRAKYSELLKNQQVNKPLVKAFEDRSELLERLKRVNRKFRFLLLYRLPHAKNATAKTHSEEE